MLLRTSKYQLRNRLKYRSMNRHITTRFAWAARMGCHESQKERCLPLAYFALSCTVAPPYLLSPTPHFKFFYTYYNIIILLQTSKQIRHHYSSSLIGNCRHSQSQSRKRRRLLYYNTIYNQKMVPSLISLSIWFSLLSTWMVFLLLIAHVRHSKNLASYLV